MPRAITTSGLPKSLANYSALLYLDKQHGGHKVSDAILASYRDQLLTDDIDATGPIVQGRRLETSQKPDAWRVITYGKGTWILHMLRARMGDAAIPENAGEPPPGIRTQGNLHRAVPSALRQVPAGRARRTKNSKRFFDQWVYGTGIPQLKLTWTAKPGRVSGTLTQTGVSEDSRVEVPIEIRVGAKVNRKMVRSSEGGSPFAFPITGTATKVTLDPENTILRKP